ncbi:hypothetical protein PENARI_c033G04572 [Penicillium arizonense]|uniref:Thioester reductase (TE) domain-containing protein n=1 Tax=Penicillium arizonense TaxID=1835702 RepID=A0A1F5L4B7_PENAI|nr:hypothetical protein PENARI_c033G04572 [Penicillium arizonense]OGE48042.1 hypothetical protein PENARI_c033G04572 [Penicillium arizonense]
MHLRRLILQQFRFDPCHSPSPNSVFEMGTVSQLPLYICALQSGDSLSTADDSILLMDNLVKKYSSFRKHLPCPETPRGTRSVLLTGATGSVGAHVLFELLNDDSVSTVYCLTRRASPLKAVRGSLFERGLLLSPEQTSKVVALNGALDRPDFCLDPVGKTFHRMLDSVSLVIHTAWPVNFNLPLAQFEPHLRGLYHLIMFSLSVRRLEPAVMLFCSSIPTALGASWATIEEEAVDLNSALMGYGQSKLVGERMVSLARRSGARAYSLRIGQVSGHSKKGLWNDSEAIPSMIRSALTLRALPELRRTCSWVPVDKLATVMLELAESCSAPDRDAGPSRASDISGVAYVDDSIYNATEFYASLLLISGTFVDDNASAQAAHISNEKSSTWHESEARHSGLKVYEYRGKPDSDCSIETLDFVIAAPKEPVKSLPMIPKLAVKRIRSLKSMIKATV